MQVRAGSRRTSIHCDSRDDLKKEVERRFGRKVPDDLWEKVRPRQCRSPWDGVDVQELVDRLRKLLSRAEAPSRLADFQEMACIESTILALKLLAEVAEFRRSLFHSEEIPFRTLDKALNWIESQSQRERALAREEPDTGPHLSGLEAKPFSFESLSLPAETTTTSTHQGRTLYWEGPTRPVRLWANFLGRCPFDSILPALRSCVTLIARDLDCEPDQAIALLLLGWIPVRPLFRSRVCRDSSGNAQLEVWSPYPWLPLALIKEHRREMEQHARRQKWPGFSKARRQIGMTEAYLRLFIATHQASGDWEGMKTWDERRRRFNAEHPGRAFATWRSFRDCCRRILKLSSCRSPGG